MFNIAIYCSEDSQCVQVSKVLQKHPLYQMFRFQKFTSSDFLLHSLSNGAMFDLIVIDVEFADLDEVKGGDRLHNKSKEKTSQIFYIASKNESSNDSVEFCPLYFLSNPVDEHNLLFCIDAAIELNRGKQSNFSFESNRLSNEPEMQNEIISLENNIKQVTEHLKKACKIKGKGKTFSPAKQISYNGHMENALKSLNFYLEASERFHSVGGEGYKVIKKCLGKYVDWKYIHVPGKMNSNELEIGCKKIIAEYNKSKDSTSFFKQDIVPSSEYPILTIFDLIECMGENELVSRQFQKYLQSKNIRLTSVLILLIELSVDDMSKNERQRIRDYAQLIRSVYMTVENTDRSRIDIYGELGYTKKNYENAMKSAISLISKSIFGFDAGGVGFAQLVIKDTNILFKDQVRKAKPITLDDYNLSQQVKLPD